MKPGLFSKKMLLTMFSFLFFLAATAQKLILPAEVSSTLLKGFCEDAAINVEEIKDSYLQVKETFKIYIDIDEKKRYLYFNISYPMAEGTTAAKAHEFMNLLNREILLVKCYYDPAKNTIKYAYDFWIEGGFTNRTFISAIKMFSSAISLSLKKDTGKLIK